MSVAANRNRLISRLHMLKRDLRLDDDLYRDKLEAVTGKRSAADLNDEQLEIAVKAFRNGANAGPGAQRLPATKQARFIQAQWISLYNLGLVQDRSDKAIIAFIKRQTKLDAAVWLQSHGDIVRVVEALKDWMARDGGVDWSVSPDMPDWERAPAYRVCKAQWLKLLEIGGARRGFIHAGHERPVYEGLYDYAAAVTGIANVTGYGNAQWARVSQALGKKLRATLSIKERAA